MSVARLLRDIRVAIRVAANISFTMSARYDRISKYETRHIGVNTGGESYEKRSCNFT
jgi:hypothetical protein